jgi:hypothetical protein
MNKTAHKRRRDKAIPHRKNSMSRSAEKEQAKLGEEQVLWSG